LDVVHVARLVVVIGLVVTTSIDHMTIENKVLLGPKSAAVRELR
jgi:hypothetical protein